MESAQQSSDCGGLVTQFHNVFILKDHRLIQDDLWIQGGKIIDPRRRFYGLKKTADVRVDGKGLIIAPGFIDIQINGGFGVDFSDPVSGPEGVPKVAQQLPQHGVTSFVPTIITSQTETYRSIIPRIAPHKGSKSFGAEVIGLHLEGPFINVLKYGAHQKDYVVQGCDGTLKNVVDVYGGNLEGVKIITLAPELPGMLEAIPRLKEQGIVLSAGHSMSSIDTAEKSVDQGVTLITHLFNAMIPFHHRDPGLVGLLGTNEHQVFYSLIVDEVHSHPASVKIAYKAYPQGCVLVTDAIQAMGLPPGTFKLGTMTVDIKQNRAYISGTDTLAGSVATMDFCVRTFRHVTGCSIVEALEAASLHPAQVLGITATKGTLEYGSDADFVLVDNNLDVHATYIAGELAWSSAAQEKKPQNQAQ